MPLRPVVRWTLEEEAGTENVDDVLLRLLAAVEERGTLRAAAAEAGISYRHAWGMVADWSRRLGAPLVLLHRGRGARLAPFGEAWLRLEREASNQLADPLSTLSHEANRALRAHVEQTPAPLRICASHGFEIVGLRDTLGTLVELELQGSLESLERLKASRCEAAGFHVPLGRLGRRLWARFGPLLDGRRVATYHVALRRQGLIVAPALASRIGSLSDLVTQPAPRFVNRQRGSGTRLLLDELLADAGLDSVSVRGYGVEEHTHSAVAATIASGAADVGFGVEDAARQFDLAFVPMALERYTLAVPRNALGDSRVERLLRALRELPAREDGEPRPGQEITLERLISAPETS